MKRKIKCWICSDKSGTHIFDKLPKLDNESQLFLGNNIKVDNSTKLYPQPVEIHLCVETPKKKKPKKWCHIRLHKETLEESMETVKIISSIKQFIKRFPKYHNFRIVSYDHPLYDFPVTGGWKHNYAVIATTRNKYQSDEIIAYVDDTCIFDK